MQILRTASLALRAAPPTMASPARQARLPKMSVAMAPLNLLAHHFDTQNTQRPGAPGGGALRMFSSGPSAHMPHATGPQRTKEEMAAEEKAELLEQEVARRDEERKAFLDARLDDYRREFPAEQGFRVLVPENPGNRFNYERRPVVIANKVPIPEEVSDMTTRTAATAAALREVAAAESELYALVEVNGKIHDVQIGDVIVTGHSETLQLGDVIVLDRATEIGGLDYMIKGNPYVHPDYHCVRAVVVSKTRSRPIATLQMGRKHRNKRIVRQMSHTLLRVIDIGLRQ